MGIADLAELLKSIKNPTQAQGLALNLLAKKSPETANMIAQMIKSGVPPGQALRQFASEGKISLDQLNRLKQSYSALKKTGALKIEVPDAAWQEAEEALTQRTVSRGSSDWF